MTMSFKMIRNLGLLAMFAILVVMGLVALTSMGKIRNSLSLVVKEERPKLEKAYQINELFISARDIFLAFANEEITDITPAMACMDEAIKTSTALKEMVTEKEKEDVRKFITYAKRFKVAFNTYAEEFKIDPTGTRAISMGKIALTTAKEVNESSSKITKRIRARIQACDKNLINVSMNSQKMTLGGLLIGTVTGLLVAIFMGRGLSVPLRKLITTTTLAAKTLDLTQRVEVKTKDEIGQLGTSFNKMLDEIQKRNEELQTMNEELRNSNEELQTSNEELQSTTEELEAANEELRTAQEKLVQKEKLAAVGQLASGVGHELRNPLGVIKNAAYYIKSKIGPADPRIAKHLDIMEREINNSNKIISDLLNFSRTRKPDLIPVEINEVIEETIPVANIPEKVRVNRNLTSGLPKPAIDRDQIRQVFLNMILNACQAMPEGGELKISSRLHKAGLKIEGKEKDCLEIEFADTGTGIPPENLKKMFDPFFTTKAKGIGLGLAVSKGIIEKHQGDIEIKSELNKGATFIVKLSI